MLHIEFHFDLPSIFREEDLCEVCMDARPAHSRAANSAVQGRIRLKFELIQDVMVILVTSKNEEDLIKIEGTRVATIQNIEFSKTKGQLTSQSEVGSGQNSNSSEIL